MNRYFFLPLVALALSVMPAHAAELAPLRPPAVPLVATDPYFSIWSGTDKLNGSETHHWTGKPHTLRSLVRRVAIGLRWPRTRSSSPVVMPPSSPPARLLARRKCAGASLYSISSWTAEPGRRAPATPSPISTALTA